MSLMASRRSSAASGLATLAALLYVAAVVIALPLGVKGVIDEKYCAIPLAAANILLAMSMLGSKKR
jgi:hypothetical protein